MIVPGTKVYWGSSDWTTGVVLADDSRSIPKEYRRKPRSNFVYVLYDRPIADYDYYYEDYSETALGGWYPVEALRPR